MDFKKKIQEKMDKIAFQKSVSSNYCHGNNARNFHFVKLKSSARHGKECSLLRRVHVLVRPDPGKTWKFHKYPNNPKWKWDELARQVTDMYHAQKNFFLKGYRNLQKKFERDSPKKQALQRRIYSGRQKIAYIIFLLHIALHIT